MTAEGSRVPSEFERELAVSFTGHRASKLPWGDNEQDPRCLAFKRKLEEEIEKAYGMGYRFFLSGMAEGFDLIAAEAVLSLEGRCPEIKLVCVFPHKTGLSARKRSIARRAYCEIVLSEGFVPGVYMVRNRFLVEHSQRIICGYGGHERSGTAATMRMAVREGLDIVIINT